MSASAAAVPGSSLLAPLCHRNAKRSHWMFSAAASDDFLSSNDVKLSKQSMERRVAHAVHAAFLSFQRLPAPVPSRPVSSHARQPAAGVGGGGDNNSGSARGDDDAAEQDATTISPAAIDSVSRRRRTEQTGAAPSSSSSSALTVSSQQSFSSSSLLPLSDSARAAALSRASSPSSAPRARHAPWRLLRVMAGHTGWVRAVCVDPGNDFLVSGSADRTLKVWDLASGSLRLTLTGHVSSVRALCLSSRHPYLFSASEDKTVKCWDLEANAVVRSYHGHLSGVYCLALHPQLDLLVSGGRDSVCRLWDLRLKAELQVLSGHSGSVASLLCQASEPQLLSGSHDATIRLWDIRTARSLITLTQHKKAVRALQPHPTAFTFASASADSLRVWACPDGRLLRNLSGGQQQQQPALGIVNALAVNRSDLLVSGGDDGRLGFWDWSSGRLLGRQDSRAQSGSLDSEQGVFALCFDVSGSRLITAEADKTIKVYAENDSDAELEP